MFNGDFENIRLLIFLIVPVASSKLPSGKASRRNEQQTPPMQWLNHARILNDRRADGLCIH
jgi:hypothetical protein